MLVGDVSCTSPQSRGSGDSIGPTAENGPRGGSSGLGSAGSGSSGSGSSGSGDAGAGSNPGAQGQAGGPAGNAGGSVTGGGTAATAPADPSEQPSPSNWWWFAGGLLAAVVLAVAGWVVWRRRGRVAGGLDWAHRVAARLDEEGRRRGRGRGRGETVVDHATALADGPLPDERLAAAGRVVSAAMFGRSATDAATRAWVDRVIDEVIATYPPPRRRRQQVDAPA